MPFLAGMTCIDPDVRVKGQVMQLSNALPMFVRLSLYMKANVSIFI